MSFRGYPPDGGQRQAATHRRWSQDAVPLIRIASWPHWYDGNPYLNSFYEALAQYGVEHVRGVAAEYAEIRKARIDVLHLHWPEELWRVPGGSWVRVARRLMRVVGLLARLRASGIRLVWTVHNLEHHEGSYRSDRIGMGLLHRLVHLRLFLSEWARRTADERYRFSARSIVCYHGNYDGVYSSSRSRDTVRAELALGSDVRMLLGFGSVRQYKGFETAVEAVKRLGDRYHLVIAGRPLRHDVGQQLCVAADDTPNITLVLRRISEKELGDLLTAADAVVLPYRKVTGSSVLLTALTASKAIIASDLPFFREITMGEPLAAEFATPGSTDDFLGAITRFFDASLDERGQAARRIANRFHWRQVVAPFGKWLQSSA
jgi:glycosyltransferase involved in cell wall biosynthesis